MIAHLIRCAKDTEEKVLQVRKAVRQLRNYRGTADSIQYSAGSG